MKRLLITALLAPAVTLGAENQATLCTLGDSQRIIEVAYPQGEALPCEVRYDKDGDTSVLWTASNEAGYCEARAEEFVAKQVGWGWQCESVAEEQEATVDETLSARNDAGEEQDI